MFLFSWKKIYKNTGGNVGSIFLVFDMLVKNKVPKNKYDRIYKFYDKDYSGQCFIENPNKLLDNAHKYTHKEVVQYVALASFRRYSEYLSNQKTTLSLVESPVDYEIIQKNRLLSIDIHSEIHFLYEKSYDEEIKQWQYHLTK